MNKILVLNNPWGVDMLLNKCGGAHGVMVIVVGNSHSTNTLGKGMNPIILPQTMGR